MTKTALLFCPTPTGGLAEHAYYQGHALQKLGLEVVYLTSGKYLPGKDLQCSRHSILLDMPGSEFTKWIRRPWQLFVWVGNHWILALWVLLRRPEFVLLESYSEYLSPLWIWPHWLLAVCFGVRYVANFHDPIRGRLAGPAWWHAWSCSLAYKPISVGLVHGPLKPEAKVPPRVQIVEVPVGIYDIEPTKATRAETRRKWGAMDQQRVFLAFGQVRDGKNLHLAIQALHHNTDSFLVIAGPVRSASDRSYKFYQDLAAQLGVTERCCFREGFVPNNELGALFDAADFVLLTYSGGFHSQSGVLNIAARARKPVLASAAPGPLVNAVSRYGLGVVIEPDSLEALVVGIRHLVSKEMRPRWDDYEQYAAWDVNVRKLLEALDRHGSSMPRTGTKTLTSA